MTSPKTLIAAYNIRPKKQLGQNFLTDPTTAAMSINRSGITAKDYVLEIGSGLGALTIPVAVLAQKVYAVEMDRKIIDVLKKEILLNNLSNIVVMQKNILYVDIKAIVENTGHKIFILGNLPYNISSQILVKLIKSRDMISRAVLMFQKELAQRITAQPGCKDYGRITVMLKYCADIKKIAEVKASLFYPKPKVDSEVIDFKFKKRPEYLADDETFFYKVIKAAFANRRKTLKNSLSASELKIDERTARHVLENSGIDYMRRAETLCIEEFVNLSNNLKSTLNRDL
jgi:16S rRNA (adenine1518-N6/adenine1519-N6)-dimethyltransferase